MTMWLTVSPLTAARRAARWASSSGPGSMIATSPWPIMKLDVPLKVNGLGLLASTRRMRGETAIVVSGGMSKERSKLSETISPKDEVETGIGPLYSPGHLGRPNDKKVLDDHIINDAGKPHLASDGILEEAGSARRFGKPLHRHLRPDQHRPAA